MIIKIINGKDNVNRLNKKSCLKIMALTSEPFAVEHNGQANNIVGIIKKEINRAIYIPIN